MTINKARLIYFSSTHTSKQIAEAIVYGIGIKNVVSMNLTLQTVEEAIIPVSVLAVIVVFVHGGHVAPLAMEHLESIRGLNTPAVLVVIYGNRAYEKALMELDVFVIPHGLKVIVRVTSIGEHSYSTDKCPITDGRPNESDSDCMEDSGKKIMEKIQATSGPGILYQMDMRAIERSSQPFFPLFRFLRKVVKLRKNDILFPRTPWVEDESLCTHCGIYAARCLAGTIIRGDELNTNTEKCIKCCACVKACASKAGKYDAPLASLLSGCFKKRKLPQTIL